MFREAFEENDMDGISKMSLKDISTSLAEKRLSSVELTEYYINKAMNYESDTGIYITECFESAVKKAAEVDKMRMNGTELSLLAGIPFGVKDNICTKNIKTTCASRMLENYLPSYNAHVIDRLSDSVILGKTNMDEFGMGCGCENSYFKKIRNPINDDYVCGGSSGGSAAGTARGFFSFALGSDTGGSVRLPSAFCGVCGMRPTYGRVSRNGLIAFASSMDQIGPIAPNIYDLALVMNEISGWDSGDFTSSKTAVPDFTDKIEHGVKNMKIALITELNSKVSEESLKSVIDSAVCFEMAGAKVDEIILPSLKYALAAYYIISSAETSSNLERYDGVKFGYSSEKYNTLDEMYRHTRAEGFGREVKRRILMGTFVLSREHCDMYYEKALSVRRCIKREFESIFNEYDCILAPASIDGAYKIGENKEISDIYSEDLLNVPASLAGIPSVVLPVGKRKNGMPTAVQIIGKPFDEKTILRAAHALEGELNFEKCL